MIDRRKLMAAAAAALALAGGAQARAPRVMVEKTPDCGCCAAWVAHMRAAGFEVETRDVPQAVLDRTKVALGVPPELASCHTAVVEGYVIEGHVPADDVRRLLAERPDALGLSVPGMPIGSPGMEMGVVRETYAVALLRRDGGAEVFAIH